MDFNLFISADALDISRLLPPAERGGGGRFAGQTYRGKDKLNNMKKIICKVEYDTENAELVLKKTSGNFGEPGGYEESLYKTESGKYFLYVNGGEESPYAKEDIKRMSAEKAQKWVEENS